MSDLKIRIRGLKKHFGPKKVLDGIDLDIETGTGLVVIGGSGTGKSVLLKSVLGLVTPDEGSIEIDGVDVLKAPAREARALRQQIGMLFQNGALFDSLPVWENVAFGVLAQKKVGRAKARDVAVEILAQVGLGADVAGLSPSELSGGMQKRVGLARAIAARPAIMFFDEPTTGLDPIMG
ncbi:MAG: ATP-binding cassette domain-containing protein, partial [Rhodospirillales bacterium]|nr:ATP-binding cassette domain-containing protein [Rhodospirillales bacterium]